MAPRRLKRQPQVSYRNARWNVKQVRENWLILERGAGLTTHEVVWVPKGCVDSDQLDLVIRYNRQGEEE